MSCGKPFSGWRHSKQRKPKRLNTTIGKNYKYFFVFIHNRTLDGCKLVLCPTRVPERPSRRTTMERQGSGPEGQQAKKGKGGVWVEHQATPDDEETNAERRKLQRGREDKQDNKVPDDGPEVRRTVKKTIFRGAQSPLKKLFLGVDKK